MIAIGLLKETHGKSHAPLFMDSFFKVTVAGAYVMFKLFKVKEFTLLDWMIHFGVGANLVVAAYIVWYVLIK
jgi:hypothetical protein